jgi:hypothetical protein
MLKRERRLWMREFSDLRPFDDILVSFFQISGVMADSAAGRGLLLPPETAATSTLLPQCVGNIYFETKTPPEQ